MQATFSHFLGTEEPTQENTACNLWGYALSTATETARGWRTMKFPMQADTLESARLLASVLEVYGDEFWIHAARELIAQAILTLSIRQRGGWTVQDLLDQIPRPVQGFEPVGLDETANALVFDVDHRTNQAIAATAAHAVRESFLEREGRAA